MPVLVLRRLGSKVVAWPPHPLFGEYDKRWVCMAKFLFLVGALTLALASAQERTEPSSAIPPGRALSLPETPNVLRLPLLGPEELDSVQDSQAGPSWSGISRSLPDELFDQHGGEADDGWTQTASGPVWRFRLISPYARFLRIQIRDMAIGDGKLWIYSDGDQRFGPFSGAGPYGDGEFWSSTVHGDSVLIEYEPARPPVSGEGDSLPFRIATVGHLWHLPILHNAADPVPADSADISKGTPPLVGPPRSVELPMRWVPGDADDTVGGTLSLTRPSGFRLAARREPSVYLGDQSYRFDVRDGVESIEVTVHSDSISSDIGLFVRSEHDIEVVDGRVVSDYSVEGSTGKLVLVISRNSDPPLKSGTYFASLASSGNALEVAGTITVSPRAVNDYCYQDATCRTRANQDLDGYASAVALIEFVDEETKRHGFCSGALINDSDSDSWIPYFLTAAHCVNTETEARSVEAHWFYQNRNCGGEPSRVLDSRYQRTLGATLLAVEDGSLIADQRINAHGLGDIALLRLRESPGDSWFLGWQTGRDAIALGTNVIGIHHAESKTKQISYGEIDSLLSNMLYVQWGNGLTLGGASGSPLLSEEGRILGVLSGGRNDHEGCFDQGSPTLYSALSSFYTKIRGYLEGQPVATPTGDGNEIVGGPLVPGTMSRFRLSPGRSRQILSGERSFYVDVPPNATRIDLALVSDDPSIDIDMYVRYQSDPTESQNDWNSIGSTGNEEIVIRASNRAPVRAGRYYVSLLLYDSPSSFVGGTLTATLTMGVTSGATGPAGIQFARIPAGSFTMGSNAADAYPDERPVTQVHIDPGFEMGKHEVTQIQWQSLMGGNPSWDSACGTNCPVTDVSWNDAQDFIERLNAARDGYEYRLPTEAEWEYGARAGTTGTRHGPLDQIAWHMGNSADRIHPVGLKSANNFGLYDMIGNVWEWVADWHGAYPGGAVTNYTGPSSGSDRVNRGGSKHQGPQGNRSAIRYRGPPDVRYSDLGFRVVRVPSTPPPGGALLLGESKRFLIPGSEVGKLQNGSRSYVLEVPPGSSALTLTLAADHSGVDLDLYVRHGADAEFTRHDWKSAGSTGNEVLQIGLGSNPPLRSGRYFVAVVLFGTQGASASGTVTATLSTPPLGPADIEFVGIPAGSFTMGSTSSEAYSHEQPLTGVRIRRGFELGRFEVTQGQWQSVMGRNPSWDSRCGPNCPVTNVSWDDTQGFIARLNADGGPYEYRLPTEAEWEYAARAGTTTDRYGDLGAIAWHSGNSGDRIHPVGQKSANPFGLHDMIGNVYEWVRDWYGSYPGGSVTDPTGPTIGAERVLRGGSKHHGSVSNRSSNRLSSSAESRYADVGFRVLRLPVATVAPVLGGRLTLGVPKEFTIPANESRRLQNGARSFYVDVPVGAVRLTISVVSEDPGIDVDLFVTHLRDNRPSEHDWSSQGVSGNERIHIGADSPLQSGRYYVSLLLYEDPGKPAKGSVRATVTR